MFKSLKEVQEILHTKAIKTSELRKEAENQEYIVNFEETSDIYIIREKP